MVLYLNTNSNININTNFNKTSNCHIRYSLHNSYRFLKLSLVSSEHKIGSELVSIRNERMNRASRQTIFYHNSYFSHLPIFIRPCFCLLFQLTEHLYHISFARSFARSFAHSCVSECFPLLADFIRNIHFFFLESGFEAV